MRRRVRPEDGTLALAAYLEGDQTQLATAVRYLLEELGSRHPGNSVEVRVPPFGAVQCVEGPRHTRGTPPNVVELATEDWVQLATGRINWDALQRAGRIQASGTRANLSELLPLN